MRAFPLLDLASLWHDARELLGEFECLARDLYDESDQTWHDMKEVALRAVIALQTLADLPPGIREGISEDEADLAAMEDRADASSS